MPVPPCNSGDPRKQDALARRTDAANLACSRDLDPDLNADNGDEDRYTTNPVPVNDPEPRSFAAQHTKGMGHNNLGEVAPRSQYVALLDAVAPENREPADFEAIPRGPQGPVPVGGLELRRYVNPQSGIAFALEAPDAPQAAVIARGTSAPQTFPAAPTLSSAEAAAELAEVYWMALLREVPFRDYRTGTANPLVNDAVASLRQFSDFRGPKAGGQVTAQTLFRGGNYFRSGGDVSGGELKGPLLSQFLLIGTAIEEGGGPPDQFSAGSGAGLTPDGVRVIPPGSSTGLDVLRKEGLVQFGTITIDQRVRAVQAGLDFMTDYPNWLEIQQGLLPRSTQKNVFTGQRLFIHNGRQLANWVHFDQTYQAYYTAALLLLGMQGRAGGTSAARSTSRAGSRGATSPTCWPTARSTPPSARTPGSPTPSTTTAAWTHYCSRATRSSSGAGSTRPGGSRARTSPRSTPTREPSSRSWRTSGRWRGTTGASRRWCIY